MKFSIYQGTIRIAETADLDPKHAWKEARAYVRAMAHAHGYGAEDRIEFPAGRVRIERGIYNASNSVRLPVGSPSRQCSRRVAGRLPR